MRAGFCIFSGEKIVHRARAARPRGFEGTTTGSGHDRTLPPLVLSHAIENQNSDSLANKFQLALLANEVRVLIFDDPSEN